jgi:hypothetical protein
VKRPLLGLVALALLAAHVVYWYLPRERAVAPAMPEALSRRLDQPAPGVAPAAAVPAGEPLAVLAAGAYDLCVWVPYPHQNLGALASAVDDLAGVIAAAARLSQRHDGAPGDGAPGKSSGEPAAAPQELPTFGPFEVPPANELVVCADLAGGRMRVVARIYPALAVVARLAGRLAGNPWLAGGDAGRLRIGWSGRLWTVIGGEEAPPSAGPAEPPPTLPESLAVVRWQGARAEIPAGYYALARSGPDLSLARIAAAPGAPVTAAPDLAPAGTDRTASSLPALVVAVGSAWHGGPPPGLRSPGRASPETPHVADAPAAGSARAVATAPLPPAALAMFESGSSHLSSLGDLPGLAVFNVAGPPGSERWSLPASGILRLLAGRLPAADLAGWHVVALDGGSLRQAEALAPRLAAQFPADPAASAALSFGLWLDPRSSLRIVARVRRFVENFPLASRREVELWRDWQTVLEPFAHCSHATLTAAEGPPAMRLLLQGCTASRP